MWLNTASLTMDYFWPITRHFFIQSEVLHRTGRTHQILIRFTDESGRLLALSRATLIESPRGES